MNQNTIVLRGKGHHEEAVLLTGTVLPGQPVIVAGSENAVVLSNAGIPFWIVKEDALQGRTVRIAYKAGEKLFIYKPLPGDVISVLVASGQTIGDGTQAVLGAGGKFVAGSVDSIGYFLDTSDGAPLAEDTLMSVRIE